MNTTWNSQRWLTDSATSGITFKNAFYAIRLHGLTLPKEALPARLTVVSESGGRVTLRLTCVGLEPGTKYRVERRGLTRDGQPPWSERLTADGSNRELEITLDTRETASFRCVPVS